jgi:hypothetical protein
MFRRLCALCQVNWEDLMDAQVAKAAPCNAHGSGSSGSSRWDRAHLRSSYSTLLRQ